VREAKEEARASDTAEVSNEVIRKVSRVGLMVVAALALVGCDSHPVSLQATTADVSAQAGAAVSAGAPVEPAGASADEKSFVGFDRNTYPGDARLAELHKYFAFAGYWLNNPPGAQQNTWVGHRAAMVRAGFGFAVLFNGRLDAEIRHAKVTPDALGRQDARDAIVAAQREGFPAGTIVFLDQEEGGRLLPEQSAYFFGFTETIAGSPYRAGSYLSGQPSDDGPGTNGKRILITTAQDVRETVAAKHLHPVALWVAQDACPPAPGCTVEASAVEHLRARDSGTLDAAVWQYAQSPQRPELTRACAATYAKDGNCYAGVTEDLYLDLNVAGSGDPSHGR
jgi:hypothetical protein